MGLPAGGPPDGELTLSDEHRGWLISNLLDGVGEAELREELGRAGVPDEVIGAELRRARGNPVLGRVLADRRRLRQLEMINDLRRQLERAAPSQGGIERVSGLSRAGFYERYFAANRPVILPDFCAGWPALGRWSPAYLRERLGAVEVEATIGREGDPDYDMNARHHARRMTMAALVDAVEGAGHSNDLYLVANNRAMDIPELRALLADVDPDPGLVDRSRDTERGAFSFWFGPAGTVTPLHHDGTNILFCQIFGRKRFTLYSPAETALLEGARGYYAGVSGVERDPTEDPRLAGVPAKVVELQPGETLFLPVGWWHHVRSLDISISVSFLGLHHVNRFDSYRPGGVR